MKVKDTVNAERRRFMTDSAMVGATLVAGTGLAGVVMAAEHGGDHDRAGVATEKGVRFGKDERACATCVFWGGTRKLIRDGDAVVAKSLGWCNNPESPNYGKLTSPEHLMPQWKKWGVLG